jgi:catechol 2,3-dioxygenase-like lactoylglutathione lyase family enzyme
VTLGNAESVNFVASAHAEEAKRFYGSTLGFRLESDHDFALVFRMPDGRMLRVQKVRDLTPQPFTVLGWEVDDVRATVRGLRSRGVEFLVVPGLTQDPDRIWNTPDGTHVAWFKDPDGNILSLADSARRSSSGAGVRDAT